MKTLLAPLLISTSMVAACVQTTDFEPSEDTGASDDATSLPATGVDPSEGPDTDAVDTDAVDTDTGPLCGNGMLDPDETCDDGNAIEGDGCQSDCTPTGGVTLWTMEDTGLGMGRSVVALPDGGFVVGTFSYVLSEVIRFDAEGQPVWTQPVTFEELELGELALSPDGDILVVASNLIEDEIGVTGELRVGELSVEDGSEQWAALPDIPLLYTWGRVMAVGPDGALWVGGFVGGEGGSDVLMARLAADGTLQWWDEAKELASEAGGLTYGWTSDVVALPDGSAVFAGGSGTTSTWVRRVDAGGQELWTTTFTDLELAGRIALLERRGDGVLYLVGRAYDDDGEHTAVVELTEDGNEQGSHAWKRGGVPSQTIYGTALSGDGTLYLAGLQADPNGSLYGALDGQGEPRWSDVLLEDEPPHGHGVFDAAVLSDGGVVFVGAAGDAMPNAHLWIRKTEP